MYFFFFGIYNNLFIKNTFRPKKLIKFTNKKIIFTKKMSTVFLVLYFYFVHWGSFSLFKLFTWLWYINDHQIESLET